MGVDAVPQRQRGTWKVDDKTGELVEQPAADSYVDKVERERRAVAPSEALRRARGLFTS